MTFRLRSGCFLKTEITYLVLLLAGASCSHAAGRIAVDPSVLAEQRADRVTSLPGQPHVSFEHYAGYICVDEASGKNMFYWFFHAQEDPMNKPVVLWLNGGPGASSIGIGEAQELGPFLVTGDKNVLKLNNNSWNKAANMLFLDSPIGVGFSYSNTCSSSKSDLDKQNDTTTANMSYEFLVNWYERFPQFGANEFYIAGESYAGHYVTQLASLILDKNSHPGKRNTVININGILLGNAVLDDDSWNRGVVASGWHRGIIGDEVSGLNEFVGNGRLPELINVYDVYQDPCSPMAPGNGSTSGSPSKRRMLLGYDPCLDNFAGAYFTRPEVQKALHARSDKLCFDWWFVSIYVNENYHKVIPSVLDKVKGLIDAKLRVWIYSGDTDGMVPLTVTRYDLAKLSLKIKVPWTPWFRSNRKVGGWTVRYDGLSFVTVRGAGHMVPTSTPKEGLYLFQCFLADKQM